MAAFLGYEATEIMPSDELIDVRVINKEASRTKFEDVLNTLIEPATFKDTRWRRSRRAVP